MLNEEKNIRDMVGNPKSPFQVPAGYFQQNAEDLKKISQQEHRTSGVLRLLYAFAVAASIALMAIFFIPDTQDIYFDTEDILALVEEGYLDFDQETLAYLDFDEVDFTYFSEEDTDTYLELEDLDYLENDMYNE